MSGIDAVDKNFLEMTIIMKENGFDIDIDQEVKDGSTPEEKRENSVTVFASLSNRKRKNANNNQTQAGSKPILTGRITHKTNDLQQLIDFGKQPSQNLSSDIEIFFKITWLHFKMPMKISFTTAGLFNNKSQGILHSFIRHWDQWSMRIEKLNEMLNEEICMKDLLEKLSTSCQEISKSGLGREKLEKHEKLDSEFKVINDSQKITMLRAQSLIYKFMRNIFTHKDFFIKSVNYKGKLQILFKVGEEKMVVSVSNDQYQKVDFFNDDREVRAIITVFFVNQNEYDRRYLSL